MSTKTITLSEDAYDRLALLKKEKESFSDVVRRLTVQRPLLEFAGLLSKSEATSVSESVRKGRKASENRWVKLKKEFPA